MTLLQRIFAELAHLFVDDGALSLRVVVLVAGITIAVTLLALPPLAGAVGLTVGCFGPGPQSLAQDPALTRRNSGAGKAATPGRDPIGPTAVCRPRVPNLPAQTGQALNRKCSTSPSFTS